MSIPFRVAMCLLFLVPQQLLAQTKPAAPKPAPAAAAPKPAAPAPEAAPAASQEPQVTTSNFGDWALRCQHTPDNAHQNCEVSLTIQKKDQPAPIAKIALGRPAAASGLLLLILLPNNVSFPSSVQIKSDAQDLPSFDIPWQRCIPGACLAETSLTDADLVRWHALDKAGKITFRDALNNEVGIDFSFQGFGQALDALAKSGQ